MIKNVCVQGLGFVGIATATVVASINNKNGNPKYNVIGVELNTPDGRHKIDLINKGELYFACDDEDFKLKLKEAVLKNKNLIATFDNNVYSNADVVLIAISIDVKKDINDYFKSEVLIEDFENAIKILGEKIKPECLIIIETTLPPGTTKKIAEKIMLEEFEKRGINSSPLICHSYERVTPGKNYLNSIINFYRNYSTNNNTAKIKAESFLISIINTVDYPLTYFINTNSTEIAKILENSFRATNIAFIYEWTLLAEKIGVNLFEIINTIKQRKGTHDNIMNPGFGVGGYCLPKDAILAQWSLRNLFNITDLYLEFSINGIRINDKMPLHIFDLIIQEINSIEEKSVLIFGASYLPDVFDLRNTPTKILYDKIKSEGGVCHISDPYMENADNYFDKEDIHNFLPLNQYDVIIYAVRYKKYLDLDPLSIIKDLKHDILIVDAFDIFTDNKILTFLKNNINIVGVGKGHIKNMKEIVK